MFNRKANAFLLAFATAVACAGPVLARGNDLSISDGAGEQLTIRHGFFGRNKTIVKDRLGDGYAQQKGLFGTQTSEYSLLGNHVLKKKGILGNSELDGSTMFGARFVTKKGIFGRHKTAIDLSGTNQILQNLFGRQAAAKGSAGPGGSLVPSGNALPRAANPAGMQAVQNPQIPGAPGQSQNNDVNVNGVPIK